MFQNFESVSNSSQSSENIKKFRNVLKDLKLDGFYMQRADEHLSESLPEFAERLAWLSGFTGSMGQAVILKSKAALFVDGRYTLQAKKQLDTDIFESHFIIDTAPANWIDDHASKGAVIGFDPKIHPVVQIENLKKKLAKKDIHLVPVADNPVDTIWENQPPAPKAPVSVHPVKYAGIRPDRKIADVQTSLQDDNIQHAIITMPDSIAWLLNIRGRDVPRTPLALSYMIIHAEDKPDLFIDKDKVSGAAEKHIEKYANINSIDRLEAHLKKINSEGGRILLDPDTSSYWFLDKLDGKDTEIVRKQDPCILPKAIKNEKEIAGTIAAHERDGAAMCRFLCWLDDNAASGELDEITAAKQLETFRRETKALKDISFDTISGAGPNGAIIHYRVDEDSNRKLKPGSLYLVDSGGQYLDGTTDITRTVAIGQPTKEMRTRFTQVLKGMISVTLARYPEGTMGPALDMLARSALWQAGVDYAHGTGHGVGSYLGVHEGPQSISRLSKVAIQPGMILSNEPGYYKEGKYGIRIENLILATEPASIKGGDIDMMAFDTLTLAPIDSRLIDPALLSDEELDWLNKYHAKVRKTLSPHLDKNEKVWLKAATSTMNKSS
ncbi:MAG: aminopeptidase P family protein [Methyloligellaceae bacterium]